MKTWRNSSVAAAVTAALSAAWFVSPAAQGPVVTVEPGLEDRVQARIVEALGGSRPQLGIGIRDVEQADVEKLKLPELAGVVVQSVREGSPAERGGVRADDVTVVFDGERVRGAAQLTRLVHETPAGRTVPVQVVRGGSRTDLQVTPEPGGRALTMRSAPRDWRGPAPGAPVPPVPPGRPYLPEFDFDFDMPRQLLLGGGARLGVRVSELAGELPEYFGAKSGVLVNEVTPESPAAKAGIRAGDVIASVDGVSIDRPADLRRQMVEKRDQREVKLGIVRDKKEMSVAVTLPPPAERETRRERGVRL
jgi:serine protease Do